MKRFKQWTTLYLQGMMMGVADLIPGVSGGTIAFISGLHPKLLKSLRTLKISNLKTPKKIAWPVLSAIGLGMVTTIAIGAHLIYFLLNHSIYQSLLRALFMGLIMGSVFYCSRQVAKWDFKRSLALLLGVGVAFSMSYFCMRFSSEPLYDVPVEIQMPSGVINEISNYDQKNKILRDVKWSSLKSMYQDQLIDLDTLIFSHDSEKFLQLENCLKQHHNRTFYFKMGSCGALSIGAMILPGISGNQVMQIMGCYDTIIESITTWTKGLLKGSVFNSSFYVLFSLGIGILVGIAAFSRLLIFFYQKYFKTTLALLTGFMMGSLANLWPFWKVGYHLGFVQDHYHLSLQRLQPQFPSLTSYQTGLALAMVILGVATIVLLERKLAFKKLGFDEEETA